MTTIKYDGAILSFLCGDKELDCICIDALSDHAELIRQWCLGDMSPNQLIKALVALREG